MDKTLMKGLRVLECVARSSSPMGASEVAAELGMTKSNAYRTLQTLMAAKYITRSSDLPVYEPTAKLFEIGATVGNRFAVKAVARPILEEIAQRTKEDAAVVVLDDREVIHLERVNSPHLVRSMVRTGQRLPAYCSTSGKLLLAHAPDDVVDSMEELLVPFTDRTVTTLAALRADLEKIRRDGYAIVRGEWNLQVAGVAAPIRNREGKVVAALTVSGPAERFKPKQMKEHTKIALWGAEEIGKLLRDFEHDRNGPMTTRRLKRAHAIADLRAMAGKILPKMVFDVLEGGAGAEDAVRENRGALRRVRLVPKAPFDVATRSTATSLFGRETAFPLVVGPTGFASAFHPGGDIALARGAARAGVPFVMSTGAAVTPEELARHSDGRLWFQLYMPPDRDVAANWLERAHAADFELLEVTVDGAVGGSRPRDAERLFDAV